MSNGVQLDSKKVRYGSAGTFEPAQGLPVGTVRSKEVYLLIPEYKKILDEKIDKESAEGTLLMIQATERYQMALQNVGEAEGYTLIVEEGAISGYDNVADATAKIIAALG